MSGDANAATRKVKRAQRYLKQNGEWRQFSAPTIEGGQSRIFVGLDRSDKMVRREVQTKELASLVRDALPTARVRHDRTQGIVFVEGSPRVQLDIGQEKGAPPNLWNYAAARAQNLDKDALLARFNSTFHAAEESNHVLQPWHEDLSFLLSVAPSFTTWNTRALLHHLPSTRKTKGARLAAMI
eukprot:8838998-Pyramimonas_sp.AAC.1